MVMPTVVITGNGALMHRRIIHYALIVICLLAASSCGGDAPNAVEGEPSATSETTSASTSVSPSATSSAVPSYSLSDREEFLASGPMCEQLKTWYESFPADTDGATALRYVEQCQEAPQPVLSGDVDTSSDDLLLKALFKPAISGESRAAAHRAVGQGVCEMFADDAKSLWLVGSTVRDYGGTPADYQAVVVEAAAACPSSASDLELFSTGDVLKATTSFRQALETAGADLLGFGSGPEADNQISGLAAVACQSARDGQFDGTGFFFSTLVGVSESVGDTLASRALELYCPEQATN
jgi:hypothetical protein